MLRRSQKIYLFFKRFLDIFCALLTILVFCWLILLLMLLVKLTSRGPIFVTQKRFGKNKKFFTILKFRTMVKDAPNDVPTHLMENPDQYITGFGRFLRKTSLDELPQVFNIFVGHMSVIGPRPALWNQEDLIQARDKVNANIVRPGLSGLAQVNGRDHNSIEKKAELDGEYVAKMSFWLDLKIVFRTVIVGFAGKDVAEGKANAEEGEDGSRE